MAFIFGVDDYIINKNEICIVFELTIQMLS